MGQVTPWSLAFTIYEMVGQRVTSEAISRGATHQVYPLERSLPPVIKMQVLQRVSCVNDVKEVSSVG